MKQEEAMLSKVKTVKEQIEYIVATSEIITVSVSNCSVITSLKIFCILYLVIFYFFLFTIFCNLQFPNLRLECDKSDKVFKNGPSDICEKFVKPFNR